MTGNEGGGERIVHAMVSTHLSAVGGGRIVPGMIKLINAHLSAG